MLKRGQGLSTNAIILIILGVVVLALMIIGFTVGWGNIAPWLSQDNVDKIVTQCESACATNSKYDYCTKERDLKAGNVEIKESCAVFSVISGYNQYGIDTCPMIECDLSCEDIKIQDEEGVEKIASIKESCEDTEDDISSITSDTCCIVK